MECYASAEQQTYEAALAEVEDAEDIVMQLRYDAQEKQIIAAEKKLEWMQFNNYVGTQEWEAKNADIAAYRFALSDMKREIDKRQSQVIPTAQASGINPVGGGGGEFSASSLWYTCLVSDDCYFSGKKETEEEAFIDHKNRSYWALDIGTNRREIGVYAPYIDGQVVEYTIEKLDPTTFKNTLGEYALELCWDDGNQCWRIGHLSRYDAQMANHRTVVSGNRVGISGGCASSVEENIERGEGYSNGCHVHLEYWMNGVRTTYPPSIAQEYDRQQNIPRDDMQIWSRQWEEELKNIKFTSYNPVAGQTDSSPCIGAAGVDLCKFVEDEQYRLELIGTTEYIEPIALSQDLVGRLGNKRFTYMDIVVMESEDGDARCNKKAVVLDTMNSRFTKRGDLFFLGRATNTSCTASVALLQ
jgi:hypothetical protein